MAIIKCELAGSTRLDHTAKQKYINIEPLYLQLEERHSGTLASIEVTFKIDQISPSNPYLFKSNI